MPKRNAEDSKGETGVSWLRDSRVRWLIGIWIAFGILMGGLVLAYIVERVYPLFCHRARLPVGDVQQEISHAIGLFSLLSIMMAVLSASAYLIGFFMQNKLREDFEVFKGQVEQHLKDMQSELDHQLKERANSLGQDIQRKVESNVVQNLAHLFRDREG